MKSMKIVGLAMFLMLLASAAPAQEAAEAVAAEMVLESELLVIAAQPGAEESERLPLLEAIDRRFGRITATLADRPFGFDELRSAEPAPPVNPLQLAGVELPYTAAMFAFDWRRLP